MNKINADEILAPHRAEIDRIDREIVKLLVERYRVVKDVADTKGTHNLSPVQPARVEKVLNSRAEWAAAQGLDETLVRDLFQRMIDYAHTFEADLIDSAHG